MRQGIRQTRQAFRAAGMAFCLSLLVNVTSAEPLSGTPDDVLSPYEQALFSNSYIQEPLTQRLERLERNVLGEVQNGTDAERQARLITVLQSIPRNWKESTPEQTSEQITNPTLEPVPDGPEYSPSAANQPPDATDYPIVTALERIVFSRDFLRDDVGRRLSRLEKKVFGAAQPGQPLSDRVDHLLSRYPNAQAAVTIQPTYVPSDSALRDLPADSSQFRASSKDVYAKVELLEKRLLKNQSNHHLMLTERLDRLEQQMYGKTYMGESIDARVNRLIKPFELGGNMSSATHNTSASARPNIQIGTGFAVTENSARTSPFSAELMNMLPNDVRSQLQSQTGPPVPGFQTFNNNAPIQYYNYYGTPGSQPQSQTTTTVIQPDGSKVVYGYQGANGLANPAYVGDPAFLQELDALEINVLGRVDTLLPIQTRLNNLEMIVLQKMQPGLPEVERLNAISRAWKIQQISRVIGSGKGANIGRAAGSAILGIPLNPPAKK